MAKEISRNIRLGIFVIAGTAFLIVALYLIGNKRNLFGSTFTVTAKFYNVSGLMTGNNVRFGGVDIGTVDKVEIINDSSINVVMIIDDKAKKYVKKNSLASVGTDGLMGNKLINIYPVRGEAGLLEEGDELITLRPIETDEMLRTLNMTNENVKSITEDLKKITAKFNNSKSVWSLLSDTTIAENVKQAIVQIRMASNNTAILTGDLRAIAKDVRSGKGSIGALLTDTTLSTNFKQTIVNIKAVSDSMILISGDLSKLSNNINNGDGLIAQLLMDTNLVHSLNKSLKNVESGTAGFDQNMEALKHNILFRKYFKKEQERVKKQKKTK